MSNNMNEEFPSQKGFLTNTDLKQLATSYPKVLIKSSELIKNN